MSEQTETREVSITVSQLRAAAVEITDRLRGSEMLAGLPREQLPLVHAYMLGCVSRACGITRDSMGSVKQFAELGYDDYAEHCY